jgi:hypothetical protein
MMKSNGEQPHPKQPRFRLLIGFCKRSGGRVLRSGFLWGLIGSVSTRIFLVF